MPLTGMQDQDTIAQDAKPLMPRKTEERRRQAWMAKVSPLLLSGVKGGSPGIQRHVVFGHGSLKFIWLSWPIAAAGLSLHELVEFTPLPPRNSESHRLPVVRVKEGFPFEAAQCCFWILPFLLGTAGQATSVWASALPWALLQNPEQVHVTWGGAGGEGGGEGVRPYQTTQIPR